MKRRWKPHNFGVDLDEEDLKVRRRWKVDDDVHLNHIFDNNVTPALRKYAKDERHHLRIKAFEKYLKNKKRKMEEGWVDTRKQGLVPFKEPDVLGKVVNETFVRMPNEKAILLHEDRGPELDTYMVILTLKEFDLYYNTDVYGGEVSFEGGLIGASRVPKTYRHIFYSNAFQNEFMFRLIREHGVNYDSAYELCEQMISPDGIDNVIDVDQSKENLESTIEDKVIIEALCKMVDEIMVEAHKICLANGIFFDGIFDPDHDETYDRDYTYTTIKYPQFYDPETLELKK